MRATDFEYHHRALRHLPITRFSLVTYLVNPGDVVWASVRHHSDSALLERMIFGAGSITILGSAVVDTWARGSGRSASSPQIYLGRLLLAAELGILLPLPGTILLVAGESLLVLRLVRRSDEPFTRALSRFGSRLRNGAWRSR